MTERADDPGALPFYARGEHKQIPDGFHCMRDGFAWPCRGEIYRALLAARAEAAVLREGLRGLERLKEDGDDWTYCAICKNWMTGHPNAGHDENCVLVPLLARLEPRRE